MILEQSQMKNCHSNKNMKKEKKNLVEIKEEFYGGVLICRKINGKKVPIPEMEKNFVQFNKMNFEKVKNIFGEYK